MKFCRRSFSAEPQNVALWYYRLGRLSSLRAKMKILGPKWIVDKVFWDNDSRKSRIFRGIVFLRKGERKLETDNRCKGSKWQRFRVLRIVWG